jgi:UDP-N-acetylmuramoyl-L-alanyl-D-glutamate--2,6-diaminopimelate ligase
VLSAIHEVNALAGRIITVFGCGGNRDKGKRPMMGKIAAELSDLTIITSDNPRFEEPEQIISDIEAGIDLSLRKKTLSISDRENAIKTACTLAQKNDIILVAGKGHENYQDIKGVKNTFDDKIVLTKYLKD